MNMDENKPTKEGFPMPVTQRKGMIMIPQLICLHNVCCVFGTIFLMLAAMSVTILCLMAFGLNPKESTYILGDAQITTLNVTIASTSSNNNSTNSPHISLSYGVILSIKAFNPNKRISIFYQSMKMSISYLDIIIGEVSVIEKLYQGHQNETTLYILLHAEDVALNRDAAHQLVHAISSNVIPLQVQMEIQARIIIQGSWKKYIRSGDKCSLEYDGSTEEFQGKSCDWEEYLYKCDIEVSPPTAPEGARLLSKGCLWKAKLYNIKD